jgi:NTE family protein
VGGINGIGVGSYPKARFKEAAAYVVQLWKERVTKSSDIWVMRQPLGLPALWNPSFGTNRPLKKLLRDVVSIPDVGQDVQLRFTAVDLLTGELKLYSEVDLALHGLKPIFATSSFPAVFPPEEIEERFETDGGVRDVAPLGTAIKAGCTRLVALPTQNPEAMKKLSKEKLSNTLQVGKRVIDIMSHEVLQNDIKTCEKINRWVASGWLSPASGMKRVDLDVIYPSKPLGDSLDFSGDMMKRQIEQGYEDARKHFRG